MHSQRVRHMAVACSSPGSQTGLFKQSGALITTEAGKNLRTFAVSRPRQGTLTARADLDGTSSFLGKADTRSGRTMLRLGIESALDAEHYCRKHDLSTASSVR